MARFLIGLGSNLGDRLAELVMARAWLGLHGSIGRSSHLYATEPVGPGTADYFNAALEIQSPLSPRALLSVCKRWERDRGRIQPAVRWTDRPIDLDLLWWDGPAFSSPELTLPHPEVSKRRFVLAPIRDVVPDWIHPVSLEPVETLYQKAPQIRIATTLVKW